MYILDTLAKIPKKVYDAIGICQVLLTFAPDIIRDDRCRDFARVADESVSRQRIHVRNAPFNRESSVVQDSIANGWTL